MCGLMSLFDEPDGETLGYYGGTICSAIPTAEEARVPFWPPSTMPLTNLTNAMAYRYASAFWEHEVEVESWRLTSRRVAVLSMAWGTLPRLDHALMRFMALVCR